MLSDFCLVNLCHAVLYFRQRETERESVCVFVRDSEGEGKREY